MFQITLHDGKMLNFHLFQVATKILISKHQKSCSIYTEIDRKAKDAFSALQNHKNNTSKFIADVFLNYKFLTTLKLKAFK